MANFEVQVKGLKEVQKKLDGKFLLQPEAAYVRDRLVQRINRKRKTAGYKNNPLTVTTAELGSSGVTTLATIGSPLNQPRTTGAAWLRFVHSLVNGAFMRNQLNAAVRKINARWQS